MEKAEAYTLLLLAGGKSARMGTNKAELIYKGKSFLELMMEKARQLGIEKICISGYDKEYAGVLTVEDRYPNRGPLGGIHACMQEIHTPYCLVLPVDAPLLPLEILEELLHAHATASDPQKVLLWVHGGRKEPLIAVYPTAMADVIEELIRQQPVPVFRALDRWGYTCYTRELPREQILNVNTPELYRQLLE